MEPLGITLFCDDIRFEQQNKITIVGCYGHEVLVGGELPFMLPRIGMYVQLRLPSNNWPALKLRVYFPGEKEDELVCEVDKPAPSASNVEKSMRDPGGDDTVSLMATNIPILLGPVIINAEGLIKVRVNCGESVIKAGTLKVTRAAQTTTEKANS